MVLVLTGYRFFPVATLLRAHIGIGHCALGFRVPWAVPVGHDSALRRQENMHRESFDAAVRLRHAGNTDEGILLDVGERGFDQRRYTRVIGELHVEHAAVARLYRQHPAIGLLDLAADASRRG